MNPFLLIGGVWAFCSLLFVAMLCLAARRTPVLADATAQNELATASQETGILLYPLHTAIREPFGFCHSNWNVRPEFCC